MYLVESSNKLTDTIMRDIAATLECTVAEIGEPTLRGKWHYWFVKSPIPQTDKKVLEVYGLKPILDADQQRTWDAAA